MDTATIVMLVMITISLVVIAVSTVLLAQKVYRLYKLAMEAQQQTNAIVQDIAENQRLINEHVAAIERNQKILAETTPRIASTSQRLAYLFRVASNVPPSEFFPRAVHVPVRPLVDEPGKDEAVTTPADPLDAEV